MNESNAYLNQILQTYKARNLKPYSNIISQLLTRLQTWASACYMAILYSGSRKKGTAISLASDIDFLISLTSNCMENSGGLRSIYNSLYNTLISIYPHIRKQNVSVRLNLNGLNVDITPARKHTGHTNDHWLYLSKSDSRIQTNIQKHINDISQSGRTNEIKLLKIWRELNQLDFPSIYLEYLIVDCILWRKPKDLDNLATNFLYILGELARTTANPLLSRIVDPANSNNVLSDLLNDREKRKIIAKAQISMAQQYLKQIVY